MKMENTRIGMEMLEDEALAAVTGGDANYTCPCPQCGRIAWEYYSSHASPNFTGKPTPSYITVYQCGNCKKLKQQGLVDEVPTLDV